MIRRLTIKNFRSLKNVEIELPAMATLCGPNGSGKTNFSEALEFLSQTFQSGLPFAVADKGGYYNMCFRRERRSRAPIEFQLAGSSDTLGMSLEMNLGFSLQTRGQAIRSDFYVDTEWYEFLIKGSDRVGVYRIRRVGDTYRTEAEDLPKEVEATFPLMRSLMGESRLLANPRNLLYPTPFEFLFPFASHIRALISFKLFRINPRTARQSGTPSVKGELGKYGENLPAALDTLRINYPHLFAKLEDEIREVIPGLNSLRTSYTASRQMGLFFQEEGFGLPWDAEDLSDGTLLSIALFLALADPEHAGVIVEEPENSLHPWILRKFLERCREVSRNKQVVLTTQSPLVVAEAEPENLFLVERHRGETQVVSALKRESILPEMLRRNFLDLGSYWISGAMGAVPSPVSEEEKLSSPISDGAEKEDDLFSGYDQFEEPNE